MQSSLCGVGRRGVGTKHYRFSAPAIEVNDLSVPIVKKMNLNIETDIISGDKFGHIIA